ncbi:MAG: extracellular solute-binding protein [Phycisphaeraceae bacterium]
MSKLIIILLLAVVVGIPFVLRPVADVDEAYASDGDRLIVVTPHNEQTRHEFALAFNDWRRAQGLAPVRFDWRTTGGTSDQRRTIVSHFEANAAAGRENEGIGIDLFFGGGDFEHNQLARGITIERDGEQVRIPLLVAPKLAPNALDEAFLTRFIGSSPLYHEDGRWIGTALASFGIVYNRDVLRMLDLPEPQTWADMAAPRYQGWIALADPSHSGSIAATYNIIIRRTGWNEGWRTMRQVFANARYFTSGASKVPVDVSKGEAAAGMCIDFYGRFQAGAVGGDRVGYVDPAGMTAITADPVAILRGAPNRELADQFVNWMITREAQRLWQRRIDAPDGPERFELRRQPVRQDLYTPAERAHWSDPEIAPFDEATPLPDAIPDFYGMVAPVTKAMAIDVHEHLVAAWAAIARTPDDHPDKARMIELFEAMPDDLVLHWPDEGLAADWQAIVNDPDHPRHSEVERVLDEFSEHLSSYRGDTLINARLRWTRFFRDNYREVVRLSP